MSYINLSTAYQVDAREVSASTARVIANSVPNVDCYEPFKGGGWYLETAYPDAIERVKHYLSHIEVTIDDGWYQIRAVGT